VVKYKVHHVQRKLELKMFLPNINRTQAAVSVHCRQPVTLWRRRNGVVC